MNSFAWLNDLMRWLGKWVPRIVLVRVTHRGVLFGRGGRVQGLRPGLWWYWPIVSEFEKVCITERSSLLSAQVVGSRLVAVAVVWRVLDATQVVLRFRNPEARLENTTRGYVSVSKGSAARVHEGLSVEFQDLIEIISVRIVSDGPGFALKQFTDTAVREPTDF